MRTLLAAVVLLATALACGGTPAPTAPVVVEAAPAADDAELRKERARAMVQSGYTASVYGVCRKYEDCKCNLAPSVEACVTEFGRAKDEFPPEVWACMLARDCEGLCEFSAGSCMALYAEQVKLGLKQVGAGVTCPAGQRPYDVYDLHGNLARTECRE